MNACGGCLDIIQIILLQLGFEIANMTGLQENFKRKWNVKELDSTTIARLISELEGACYLLDCIDQKDYEIVSELKKKYYKMYFSLLKSNAK